MGVAQDKLNAVGIESICEQIADGVTYREIIKPIGVSLGSFCDWLARPEFIEHYARAMKGRAEKFADEIITISDDGLNDTYVDEDGQVRTNHDVIQRSRLRVDSRKWLASKMFPKRYGEKVQQEITGANGGPLQVVDPVVLAAMTEAEIETYLSVARKLSGVAADHGPPDTGSD